MTILNNSALYAAQDPGVRKGEIDSGDYLRGLKVRELIEVGVGKNAFESTRNVRQGMGPAFNGDSCVSCHSFPATGGTSPFINPQFEMARRKGANNKIPFFLEENGPVLVTRFKYKMNPNGTLSTQRDGGVHPLFSIAGRSDADGCDLPQPDYEQNGFLNNIAFRIPTPTFGMGIVEQIRDVLILESFNNTASERAAMGIEGHPNRSAHDGMITRFGWKAQNSSAEIFSGEAYNVEMGITNELFPQERTTQRNCLLNPTPEDGITLEAILAARALSAVAKFALFMRELAPPRRGPITPSVTRGHNTFKQVGCVLCHTESFPILGASQPEMAREKEAILFSDLMVHHMGSRLADDIIQGQAGPDEFRTAPLWGIGQRIFFLHDGRTTDLGTAIEYHYSNASSKYSASEANRVVERYRALPDDQKQDLLNFLRSL